MRVEITDPNYAGIVGGWVAGDAGPEKIVSRDFAVIGKKSRKIAGGTGDVGVGSFPGSALRLSTRDF